MKRIAAVMLSMGLLFGTVAVASAGPALAASSLAQHKKDCYPNCPPKTPPSGPGQSTTPTGSTTGGSQSNIGTSTGLAFTGADVAMTLAVATVLVGMGLVIVRLSRRRLT